MPNVFEQQNQPNQTEIEMESSESGHIPEVETNQPAKNKYNWWDKTTVLGCADCGCLVVDTNAHNLICRSADY